MVNNNQEAINTVCDLLSCAAIEEDFVKIQGLISNIFFGTTPSDRVTILNESKGFYITAFENVFNNDTFITALRNVSRQYQNYKENFQVKEGANFFDDFDKIEIKNKKFIFIGLVTSVMLFTAIISDLNEHDVLFAATILKSCINKVKIQLNDIMTTREVSSILLGIFKRDFYSKIRMPITVNDFNYLFHIQKTSNYLISFSLSLVLKNASLSSLFAGIEKNKYEGKFSIYTVHRISNYIKSDLKREILSKQALTSELSNFLFLDEFIGIMKGDKNDEKAYILIATTLKEFLSSVDAMEGIINTIKNADSIKQELEIYATVNFKAFSTSISEQSSEWANKIYINCCKLLGSVGSIKNAFDAKWQINVSTKEFADWTLAIHQVLNKHDIEDDWSIISKYLSQETNKVEWKATLLTPINQSLDDPRYKEISEKMFYGVIKTMVGMMNSDGGVILIGHVEKPEDIVRKEIKEKILRKQDKYFLNIEDELFFNKIDLDVIKRKIQDSIKKETLMSIDNFNNLWEIKNINIKSEDGLNSITIIMIEVAKSDKPIFSIKSEIDLGADSMISIKQEVIWISLLKRADARTIRVDPRTHLTSAL